MARVWPSRIRLVLLVCYHAAGELSELPGARLRPGDRSRAPASAGVRDDLGVGRMRDVACGHARRARQVERARDRECNVKGRGPAWGAAYAIVPPRELPGTLQTYNFPSIYLSICLTIYLSIYLPTYLPIYLSIHIMYIQSVRVRMCVRTCRKMCMR